MISGRTCIQNAVVVTMDPTLGNFREADILVEGAKILAVGENLNTESTEVIDARGMIAMPGFVDCHRHVWQSNIRHVASNWTLMQYLLASRVAYAGAYSVEDMLLGQYAGALEALDAGITTVVDHAHNLASPEHVDAAIEGTKKSGIRSVFCYGMGDVVKDGNLFEGNTTPAWHFDDLRRVADEHLNSTDRVYLGVALNEMPFSTIDSLRKEIEAARELGARLITFHMSLPGAESVFELSEAGLLSSDMLVTHGFFLTDRELELLANHGASVVSTLDSELQMGMGYGITTRAREFGVNYSLGVDIVSGNGGDLFGQMRLSLQTQRAFHNQELIKAGEPLKALNVNVRDVLWSATVGGANAAGLGQELGSLTPGKQADIILLNCNRVGLQPMGDPETAIVMHAGVGDVDTVLVEGTVVKRNGRLLGVDQSELFSQLEDSRNGIFDRIRAIDPGIIDSLRPMGFPELFPE